MIYIFLLEDDQEEAKILKKMLSSEADITHAINLKEVSNICNNNSVAINGNFRDENRF